MLRDLDYNIEAVWRQSGCLLADSSYVTAIQTTSLNLFRYFSKFLIFCNLYFF